MDSQRILYNKVGDDESFTPDYGVKPILKYIPDGAVVWCPFDCENSEFVRQIKKTNKVVFSHIDMNSSVNARITNTDYDFFKYEPKEWDVIVSNPPFKKKRLFLERALFFGKPFALLMTLASLNDKYPSWSWYEVGKDFQLLKFDKRIHFEQNGRTKKNTTFQSGYMCCDFLPKQTIMEKLSENM